MSLKELKALEEETIHILKQYVLQGDHQAAKVLLEHLRFTSMNIEKWRQNKKKEEAEQ